MNKQAIMDALKAVIKAVNRTPGELDRAIKSFESTVDSALENAKGPSTGNGRGVPPNLPVPGVGVS